MARTGSFSWLRRCFALALRPEREEHARGVVTLSRREVLKGAMASAAIAMAPACVRDVRPLRAGDGVNVAIVGAGLAGLHCAFRLRQHGIVAPIFEASDRVGGRMVTARTRFLDGQIAELGGELIDSSHSTLRGLCGELELDLEDRSASTNGLAHERYFFEGRIVSDAEVIADFRRVAPRIQRDAGLAVADERALEALDRTSLADYLENLPEMTSVLRQLLSVAYTGEYGLEPGEQSAVNLVALIDTSGSDGFHIYGDSDERFRVMNGNDSVPSALGERLRDQLHLDAVLVSIRQTSGVRLRLTFERGSATFEETFDRVVLAIPFSTLRDVELEVPLSPPKRTLIRELGYGTNSKLLMQFRTRSWRAAQTNDGSSFADNGVQSTWEASRNDGRALGILTIYLGGSAGIALARGSVDEHVADFLPRIDAVFPGVGSEYAGRVARVTWADNRWSKGSYSCYRPGQAKWAGEEAAPASNLHFCGEHTSVDYQGFMEGACESGARAAREVIAAVRGTVARDA